MLPRYLLVIISGTTTFSIASLIVVCVLIRNKGLLAKICESKRPTSNCRTVPSKREVSAPAINSEELIPLRRIDTRCGSIPETLPPPPPLTPVATLKSRLRQLPRDYLPRTLVPLLRHLQALSRIHFQNQHLALSTIVETPGDPR